MLTDLLETFGVAALGLLGVALARWFSRLPRPWWTLGYFIPLTIITPVALPRFDRSLEFKAPISWFVTGRTLFAVSGLVITMVLITPLSRVPRASTRRLVECFIALMVFFCSLWPFAAPAFNHDYLASLQTRMTPEGICEQSTDYNCGPAAAVTALRKLGFPAEEGEIAILAHTSTAIGTPPDLLCAALKKRYASSGLDCEYRYFHSTAELKNGGITLAVIKFGLFVDHYVAVLDVTDDQIVVGDPFRGRMSFSHQEFSSKWRFVGVVLKRTDRR
jgi:predicted double-glycine peptidase